MSASEIQDIVFSNQAQIANVNANKIDVSEKGSANGVCPLNATSKVEAVYLPAVVSAPVDSVHGRVGVVVSANNDYNAGQVQNTPAGNISSSNVQSAINELDTIKIESSLIGVSNGVCDLDVNAKVPSARLPAAILIFKGLWNATTNSPSLSNGVGVNGEVYVCNVAGTVNFGAGNITFAIKDWAVYNSAIWSKVDNTDNVVTVFGRDGAVVPVGGDYTASEVTNVATGGISGNTVQLAINELDNEKANSSLIGANNGICELDAGGLVPVARIPSGAGATYGTIVVPDASVFNNDGNADGSMFICSGGSGIQAGLDVVDGDIIVRIGGIYRLQLQHITEWQSNTIVYTGANSTVIIPSPSGYRFIKGSVTLMINGIQNVDLSNVWYHSNGDHWADFTIIGSFNCVWYGLILKI